MIIINLHCIGLFDRSTICGLYMWWSCMIIRWSLRASYMVILNRWSRRAHVCVRMWGCLCLCLCAGNGMLCSYPARAERVFVFGQLCLLPAWRLNIEGLAFDSVNRWEEAAHAFAGALEAAPTFDPTAANNLGTVLFKNATHTSRSWRDAEPLYHRANELVSTALRLMPSNPMIRKSHAEVNGLLSEPGLAMNTVWADRTLARYLVLASGTSYQVPGACYLVPGTWSQLPGTWYMVPGTRVPVPDHLFGKSEHLFPTSP